MMRHSRSKSFSDSLVLEDVDKGGVIVKSIRPDSSTETGLKEGDEIVGATIHFDKLKKDEVLRVLKLIEPYDENIKVLTKQDLKSGVSSLTFNGRIASPKEMLTDSYSRLFHSKVQRFLNREPCDAAKTSDVKIGDLNGQLLVPEERLHFDGVSFKDDIEGPTQNLSNMSAQTPEFSKSGPMPFMGLSSELKEPDMGDIVKCPKVNLSGLKSQDIGLNLTMNNIKGDDINVSGIDMLDDSYNDTNVPELDLKSKDVDLKSPPKKCTHPPLPEFGISGQKLKHPEFDIDANLETPDLNLSSPQIKGKNIAPELGVDLPKADISSNKLGMKTPDLDIEAPAGKFPMPKYSLSGPKVKGPDFDIDAGLKTPDLNLSAPKIKGGIKAPDTGFNLPSADLKGNKNNVDIPDIDLKSLSQNFKLPTLPKFGISGPKLKHPDMDIDGDLETPDLNLSSPQIKGENITPDLGVDLPKADISSPKLGMKTPDLDIDGQSGKFTMPKFSLSGPKVKGTNFDIDAGLKTPDLNLSAPKIKGGIKAPDTGFNLPSADMKGTKFDLKIPDVDLKTPSWEFKFPTLPKFGISGPKLKRPQIDIDGDLETPDLNLSSPQIKGKNIYPKLGVDLPKADISSPKLGIKTPDLDAPAGKFTMPKFSLSGPKVKGPDFDIAAGLKTPDLNRSAPKIKEGIKAPDIGLNIPNTDMEVPKLDLNAANVDLKSPSQKWQFPTLPKFGISGPKLKHPEIDIDGDLETPDLNLSSPQIKGKNIYPKLGVDLPKADISSPKLGIKTPDLDAPAGKFTMPKFSLSGPKVKGPDFDIAAGLKTPDLNRSAPKIKGGIKAPDIGLNIPNTDMEVPKLDLNAANVDLKSPSQKWQFPTLPKFGISGPKLKHPEIDIDGDLETPDLNLSSPQIKGKNIAAELGVDLPKADISSPKLGMKTLDLDIDAPAGKFTMSKFSLSGPKVKGPDFEIDTGLKTPNLNLSAPKIKGGIEAPDIGLNIPNTDMEGKKHNMDIPDIDLKSPSRKFKFPTLPKFGISGLKVKRPEMDIDGDLETPDLSVSTPKIKGEINDPEFGVHLPKADLNIPQLDMKTPDLDIDAPSGKFTMPKFSLSGPKVKGQDFHVAGLIPHNLSLTAPKIKGGIKAPDIGLNVPNTDMEVPKLDMNAANVDLKSPSQKWKFPTLPKFGISGLKLKRPQIDIDGDRETPDLNLSSPQIKGKNIAAELGVDLPKAGISSPKLGMKTPDLDIDAPARKFTMPKFSLSGPKMKGPDFDIDAGLKTPDLNVSAPKIKGGIKATGTGLNLPSADMKGKKHNMDIPDFDLKSPSQNLKFPTLPKFGISGPKLKHPEIDIDGGLETPDLNLSSPQIKGKNIAAELGVDLPKAGISSPKLGMKTPDLDIDAPAGKFIMPKYSLSGPKVKRHDFDIDAGLKTPDLNLTAPKIKGRIKTPKVDVDLPSRGIKALKASNFDLKSLKIKDEISFPDVIQNLPQTDLKESTLKLNTPDLDLDAPSGKLTMPTLKEPKYGLSELNMNRKQLDIDAVLKNNMKSMQSRPNIKEKDLDANLKTQDAFPLTSKVKASHKTSDTSVNLPKADRKGQADQIRYPNLKNPSVVGYVDLSKGKGYNLTDIEVSKLRTRTVTTNILCAPDIDLEVPGGTLKRSKLKTFI
ncbi:neuroblast differentiation-associated protein AHNAK-like [Conger conger]|uniref:neuroblast differentiation-associated protein AHNAK-like n=1 Tax=Conger conger TaxID=82655 RepID=UPI002A5A909C|nr:neuroblast differentiation-associated protein AHNAK-like [Conger conger]